MTNKQLLKELRVLITRPEGQGMGLGEKIIELGGKPVFFPLLRIVQIQDEKLLTLNRRLIQSLDNYDMAIFVSSNAAKFGLELIDQFWPQVPSSLKFFAIGPATAAALGPLNAKVQVSPSGMLSEDLLTLDELKSISGLKIALFRGRGGRELLVNTLRDRGAQVDYIETYERTIPDYQQGKLATVIEDNCVNVICITSAQILDSLRQLVDITKSSISQIPVLVPSERVRQLALEAGLLKVLTCAGANDEAIVATLKDIARELPN
jgi:uroporphyrinogen-III synthase